MNAWLQSTTQHDGLQSGRSATTAALSAVSHCTCVAATSSLAMVNETG